MIIEQGASERFAYLFGLVPAVVTGRARLPAELALLPQPWSLLTAPLLHTNALHAVVNLVLFWWAGSALESEIGAKRLLAVVIGSAMFTGLVQVAVAPGLEVPVVGLDGAVAGLLLGTWMVWPGRPVPCAGVPAFRLPIFGLLMVCVAWLLARNALPGGLPGPAATAVLGGAVSGALLVMFLLPRPRRLFGGRG